MPRIKRSLNSLCHMACWHDVFKLKINIWFSYPLHHVKNSFFLSSTHMGISFVFECLCCTVSLVYRIPVDWVFSLVADRRLFPKHSPGRFASLLKKCIIDDWLGNVRVRSHVGLNKRTKFSPAWQVWRIRVKVEWVMHDAVRCAIGLCKTVWTRHLSYYWVFSQTHVNWLFPPRTN